MPASSSDVLIVGGGVVGAACAYYLSKAGLSVTLLERERLAWGASGRNSGFVWLSLRPAGVQLDLARAGAALYPQLVEEIGNDFEYRNRGGLIYCFKDGEFQVLRELAERRRGEGLAMEVVDGKTARELCPIFPETVAGATFCTEGFPDLYGQVCHEFGGSGPPQWSDDRRKGGGNRIPTLRQPNNRCKDSDGKFLGRHHNCCNRVLGTRARRFAWA